jgi:hypothetical protein
VEQTLRARGTNPYSRIEIGTIASLVAAVRDVRATLSAQEHVAAGEIRRRARWLPVEGMSPGISSTNRSTEERLEREAELGRRQEHR